MTEREKDRVVNVVVVLAVMLSLVGVIIYQGVTIKAMEKEAIERGAGRIVPHVWRNNTFEWLPRK